MKTDAEASSKLLDLTLDVMAQQDAKSTELRAKQERLLKILEKSGTPRADETTPATGDPMQVGIDAHEAYLQARFDQKRERKGGASDPTKPSR